MRIKMLLNRYLPVVGGAERQAYSLSRELLKQGHQVSVLTRRLNADLAIEEIIDEIPIKRVSPNGLSKLANVFIMPALLFDLLHDSKNFDILHCHTLGPVGLTAIAAGKLLRKPVILKIPTAGDIRRQETSNQELTFYTRILRKYILPDSLWTRILVQADAIIAISQEITEEATKSGLEQAIVHIPNGVDTSLYHPSDKSLMRQKLGLDEDRFYLFYSGRLVHRKRVDLVIAAMPNILEKYPNTHLLIAGSGDLQSDSTEAQLREMVASLGIEDSTEFLGNIENVVDYLQAVDAYVFPSINEGMPNAVLEAMATGLPVIASRIAGVTDILDESTGYLFTAGATESFLERFLEFMANPEEAQRRSQKALERVQSSYSIQAVAKQYEALYQKLLDKKNN